MDRVKVIDSEVTGSADVAFPSLKVLRIEDMLGWEEWSTKNEGLVAVFPCLEELHIKRCPKLIDVSLQALPLLKVASSITKLDVKSIKGLTYELWRCVIAYLREVEDLSIGSCHGIRYLWESEREASELLVKLKTLSLSNCSVQILEGGQNLKTLHIFGLYKLGGMIDNTSMPMLETLYIINWGYIRSISELNSYTNLTKLIILECPHILSLPDLQLSNLTTLSLRDCESLVSIIELSNLNLLEYLNIKRCPGIDVSIRGGCWPPKLSTLGIGGMKKPISEWGRGLNFPASLVDLWLYGQADVRNISELSHLFPSSLTTLLIIEFENLESLSMGLQHLSSLQHLEISYCPKANDLPETLLPSLLSLKIHRCPKLEERCNRRGLDYWPLISHIPCIQIDDETYNHDILKELLHDGIITGDGHKVAYGIISAACVPVWCGSNERLKKLSNNRSVARYLKRDLTNAQGQDDFRSNEHILKDLLGDGTFTVDRSNARIEKGC
ncbi:hypothetical protein M8C21_015915 [Ambrosia artemisiifolia]|uniref:Uncharacterized protein n=1 Tax=Ambrosia artemisiifolia TaxID=4212 RepID=A0AAD5DCR3_AMBAR|nr:hypothetical protein M8C21_015915 [Ambrosia artemisiifolia]